jgi:hypothetical protein
MGYEKRACFFWAIAIQAKAANTGNINKKNVSDALPKQPEYVSFFILKGNK